MFLLCLCGSMNSYVTSKSQYFFQRYFSLTPGYYEFQTDYYEFQTNIRKIIVEKKSSSEILQLKPQKTGPNFKHGLNQSALNRVLLREPYFKLLYSSSVTLCNQTAFPFSALVAMAIWTSCISGEAPCQCSTPGEHFTASPFLMTLIGWPLSW